MYQDTIIQSAHKTLTIEMEALAKLMDQIDENFSQACKLILACEGRVVVTGMGKSGHIACKIAATLASTGTPAFFVHPGEASHGDLGMITAKDVVLALSNSGSTTEIMTILPLIKRMGAKLISITGNARSPLAEASDFHLQVAVDREACPLDLAPTSSTTAALALGDALAVALLEQRGFTENDFAFSHPGGALGRKLLLKVFDIMHKDEAIPVVADTAKVKDALVEMTEKGLGMTTVIGDQGKLMGVFTDGDLRRCLDMQGEIKDLPITEIMTRNSKTIEQNILAAEALNIMEDSSITSIVIVDQTQKPLGVVHLHDLLKAGIA